MRWTEQNKYRNRKTVVDGITFDSVKEASRYQELRLMERAGAIRDLKRQVRIEIVPKTNRFRNAEYIADFAYANAKTGQTVYEDVKGYRKGSAYQMFTLKKKLVFWLYGIEIIEI